MPDPASFTWACLGWGAVLAGGLTVVCVVAHNLAVRRRLPRVTHFDLRHVDNFECERWLATGGDCCPAGTARMECPGLRARQPAR